MPTPILLPDLGASAVHLSLWFAEVGEHVYEGDRLVEVQVEGATFDVAAPATGRLRTKLVLPRQPVASGQVLGEIDGDDSDR